VLILAKVPVMTRPIAAATVLDALPKACQVDPVLCGHVRKFLDHYMHDMGIGFASLDASIARGSANPIMPNQHGEKEDSHYDAAAMGYWQPSDYLLVSAGGVAYQGHTAPTGSMISLGFDWAQLDLGYRDHWWSPLTTSSMLISTEAPTMPSATLSNYSPLSGLGVSYEVFVARMSETDQIELTNGTLTRGYPKFAGLHLGIEPVNGWSLAASRVLIFGGGAAGGQTFKDIFKALLNPSEAQTTGFGNGMSNIGKQEGAVSSRFVFPGSVPFAMYFEYAANDTSRGHAYLFGKPSLCGGLHFPRIGPLDLTYEICDWEKTWYVHNASSAQVGYLQGITNYGAVIGNWFGDQRVFGDAPGGQSNMLRLAWEPWFGGRFEGQVFALTNTAYFSGPDYSHEVMASLSYAHPWREFAVGAELDAGRDEFGAHYTRLEGFLRYGDALRTAYPESADDAFAGERENGSEMFVDLGANESKVLVDLTAITPRYTTGLTVGPHLGFGARREVSEHQDLGVRLESDDVRGHLLFAVRALDYRYRFNGPIALGAFLGAARYSEATPAYGWWFGAGAQWRNLLPGWDLNLDWRDGTELARERALPSDIQGGYRPEAFYSITGFALYMSKKF
jgi:Capsule assembly protein Wzi